MRINFFQFMAVQVLVKHFLQKTIYLKKKKTFILRIYIYGNLKKVAHLENGKRQIYIEWGEEINELELEKEKLEKLIEETQVNSNTQYAIRQRLEAWEEQKRLNNIQMIKKRKKKNNEETK